MNVIRISFIVASISILLACRQPEAQQVEVAPSPTPTVIPMAENFAYPISKKEFVTEAKDKKDDWYDAQDFGQNDHLGEDWNKNSGGNTDCGEPVYAVANGLITYAQDAGPGWGNVIIIEHRLPSGENVESLYGHMLEIMKKEGEVKKREQIGKVGNANGQYLCHLHLEIRTSDCPMWNQPGPGYARDRKGWVDPSDFIDSHR